MKRLGSVILWALLLILAPATPVLFAQNGDTPPSPAPPLILTDDRDQYPLGLHLEILEDPTGQLTIEDVASPEAARSVRFTPSQQKTAAAD